MDSDAEAMLFKLWAKSAPPHPLPCHMVDVGSVASALLTRGPFQGTVRRFQSATDCPNGSTVEWLAYLSSLHDLGKCNAQFQANGGPDLCAALVAAGIECRRTVTSYRHEAFGATWVCDRLRKEFGWSDRAAVTVAAAIRGHHGDFNAGLGEGAEADAATWEPLRAALEHGMRRVFFVEPWTGARFPDHSVAGLLLSGLIVLSDWIASNTELFEAAWSGQSLKEYAEISSRTAERAVQLIGLDQMSLSAAPRRFEAVWPSIAAPHPVQVAVQRMVDQNLMPGLTIIEAPMGEGKTEAALYLASQWIAQGHANGMYVALPTAATSNQMFGRVQEFLGREDGGAADGLQLVHGASWLLDRATPVQAPNIVNDQDQGEAMRALDWFQPRKRSLLAEFGVGTVDQAEMSVLNVKHGFLRLYGLAHKVLIIDEVHAYDAYQTEIIRRLLDWCRSLEVPVILLSATLPQTRKNLLIKAYREDAQAPEDGQAYPLITHVAATKRATSIKVDGSSQHATVDVCLHPGLLNDPVGTARLVAQRVRKVGGCHAVIANTVGSAQAIFQELRAILQDDGIPVDLFHARFPLRRRQELEHAVLTLYDKRSLTSPELRPPRSVLVATQVVEQSLDIDFDEMYTQLAPIDLLLQRSGRLHRHNRKRPPGRPALHVLTPPDGSLAFGPSQRVYHPYVLARTLTKLLESDPRPWRLPEDMRDLVESVYGIEQDASDFAEMEADWVAADHGDASEAKRYLVPGPSRSSFKLGSSLAEVFSESDKGANSYFTARTRNGRASLRVALLEADEFAEELHSLRAPSRQVHEEILLRVASVPAWWLAGAEPCEGYRPPQEAANWLFGITALRLREGRWLGAVGQKVIGITSDPILGVIRSEKGERP